MNHQRLLGLGSAAMLASLGFAGAACSSSSGDGGGGFSNAGATSAARGGSTATGTGGATSTAQGGATTAAKGGSTGTTSGGSTGTTAHGGSGATGPACPGVPATDNPDATCTGFEQEAEVIPVDMYIMMDRSCSMNYCVGSSGSTCSEVYDCAARGTTTRWTAVHDALQQFVTMVAGKNIRAGIGFFGASISGGDDKIDCDITNYSTPKVPIGDMKTAGPLIAAAIDAPENQPGGLTPTYPALQGAVNYGKEWAVAHPGRQTVVVLVTDGYPTQCQDPVSIQQIAGVAQAAYEANPSVRTYVVGLSAGFNLDTIAQAGGSNTAFLLDNGDVTNSLVQTLLNITASKVACTYQIPPPPNNMAIDPDQVQVLYSPAVGAKQEVPKIDNAGSCSKNPNGGWYFDNPNDPQFISVCPCTCSNFQAAGNVSVGLGCTPYPGIR
jgi:hypothetical protein